MRQVVLRMPQSASSFAKSWKAVKRHSGSEPVDFVSGSSRPRLSNRPRFVLPCLRIHETEKGFRKLRLLLVQGTPCSRYHRP